MTSDAKHAEMKTRGYILIREHCPWGHTDVYKNHATGDIRFIEWDVERTGQQQYDMLRRDWRPATQAARNWHAHKMEKWFNMTASS